jgi:pimeloyl-ACP methyl ester carboxylesterase
VATVTVEPGVDIWYEVAGREGPAVVLLAGATFQAVQWEPAFVEPIVAAGYQVVRFDWRDVGSSTWRSFREHPYTGVDFVDDVIAIIDDAGLHSTGFEQVHLVGFSMGGVIAQLLAGLHPERVRSLTTLSAGFAGDFVREDTPRYREVWSYLTSEKPAGPGDEELESFLLGQWRGLCGKAVDFDEAAWRERIRSWIARGHNPRCPHMRTPAYEQTTGEWIGDPDGRTAVVRRVTAPTLVVHGDDDGMFTLGNAHAICDAVPHAELHVLSGRGHDLFVDPLEPVHELLLAFLARS